MKFKALYCRYYEETFIKRMATCFLMKPREINSHVKRLWIWDLKYIHTILGKGKVLELYVQYEIDTMESRTHTLQRDGERKNIFIKSTEKVYVYINRLSRFYKKLWMYFIKIFLSFCFQLFSFFLFIWKNFIGNVVWFFNRLLIAYVFEGGSPNKCFRGFRWVRLYIGLKQLEIECKPADIQSKADNSREKIKTFFEQKQNKIYLAVI